MTSKREYNIIRRAYSQSTIVARMVLSFTDAELTAMAMRNERQDGEYFAVPAEHGMTYPATGADQHFLPIAWV